MIFMDEVGGYLVGLGCVILHCILIKEMTFLRLKDMILAIPNVGLVYRSKIIIC